MNYIIHQLLNDEEINLTMPNITSSRRAEPIKLVNSKTLSIVSVNHDTEEETKRSDPDRTYPLSELTIINTKSSEISLSEILPKLTMGTDSQPYAVDAHSMAVGDINGDGFDDRMGGAAWGGVARAPRHGGSPRRLVRRRRGARARRG